MKEVIKLLKIKEISKKMLETLCKNFKQLFTVDTIVLYTWPNFSHCITTRNNDTLKKMTFKYDGYQRAKISLFVFHLEKYLHKNVSSFVSIENLALVNKSMWNS